MKNYYQILGVSKEASRAEIKKAYIILAKKYHPDSANENEDTTQIFADISEAYDILSDKEKRKEYDEKLEQYQKGIDVEKQERQEKFMQYFKRGKRKIFMGDYMGAEKFIQKVYEHFKYTGEDIDSELLSYYGFILVVSGRNKEEGLKMMDKAIIDSMFNDHNLILNLAEAYFIIENKKKGRELLKRALTLKPRSKRASRIKQKYDNKKNGISGLLESLFRRK